MGIEDPELSGRGEEEEESDMASTLLSRKRRCCFCLPCLGSPGRPGTAGSTWWQRMRAADHDGEKWWAWGIVKKTREWSEIVAGPKWKTFIRRFNRNKSFCGGAGGGGVNGKQGKFQYDAYSYALNFNDTAVENGGSDENHRFRNFSSRYASIPFSSKAHVDGS